MASVLRSFKSLPLRAMAPVRPAKAMPIRSFTSTMLRKAGGPVPPQLYGPGGKAGEVPTDEEQATGIERLELLGDLLGVDVFDNKAPEMTRMGTLESPIPIFTLYPERIVGCTGFPADSHDTNWIRCEVSRKHNRCNECGCVYTLDFQGDKSLLEHHDDHHH